jgi:hypothetical protein
VAREPDKEERNGPRPLLGAERPQRSDPGNSQITVMHHDIADGVANRHDNAATARPSGPGKEAMARDEAAAANERASEGNAGWETDCLPEASTLS